MMRPRGGLATRAEIGAAAADPDLAARLDEQTAAVIVQSPNFFGVVDALPEAAAIGRNTAFPDSTR